MATIDDLRRIAEDANLSKKLPDRFGYHWECKDISGAIFRYDNFPDKNWEKISTYPFSNLPPVIMIYLQSNIGGTHKYIFA